MISNEKTFWLDVIHPTPHGDSLDQKNRRRRRVDVISRQLKVLKYFLTPNGS